MTMKFDFQWPHAVVFATVTLVLGGLVYVGKLPADTLSVLLAWLVPSPLGKKDPA
jgi:hypothetical protein